MYMYMYVYVCVHVLTRDEKANKIKQITRQSNTAHPHVHVHIYQRAKPTYLMSPDPLSSFEGWDLGMKLNTVRKETNLEEDNDSIPALTTVTSKMFPYDCEALGLLLHLHMVHVQVRVHVQVYMCTMRCEICGVRVPPGAAHFS